MTDLVVYTIAVLGFLAGVWSVYSLFKPPSA